MQYTVKPRPGAVIPEAVKPPADLRALLRVIELFTTPMQGEGLFTGVPSIFIRFAGCTVGCFWCDTKYSWKASGTSVRPYQPRALAQEIAQYEIGNVVLTGGEPLEQSSTLLHKLITEANNGRRRHWTIETSGIILPPNDLWTSVDLWSVSPKLPFAETMYNPVDLTMWQKLWAAHKFANTLQIKFVIDCDSTPSMERDLAEAYRMWSVLDDPKPVLIFQPVTPSASDMDREVGVMRLDLLDKTRALAELLVSRTQFGPYFVRPQMHALLWGWRRGI